MGGIEPTVDWLRESLKKKHVITANKDLLAVHLELLENLAEQQGVALKLKQVLQVVFPLLTRLIMG